MISPKVSVIIPNYNHGSYLKQRIDSVLDQTYKNFEVILLDDCSSDNSREVIKQYTGNRFIREVVFSDKNSGNPFKQWQRGIELSRGEWIWLAESDDYADERFLETLMTSVLDRPDVGLVYCDSKIVNNGSLAKESFADLKNRRFNTNRWSVDHCNRGVQEIEDYLLPGGTINNSSAVLFNRKILFDVNPFDANLKYIGDKYAFVKVLSASDIVYVKDALNFYRDPFNTKNVDKFVFYFYEQFVVFNWVYRNVEIGDKKKFFEGFYSNTRNSLFRGWSMSKLDLYRKLFHLNSYLLLKSISYNFREAIGSVFNRVKPVQ